MKEYYVMFSKDADENCQIVHRFQTTDHVDARRQFRAWLDTVVPPQFQHRYFLFEAV